MTIHDSIIRPPSEVRYTNRPRIDRKTGLRETASHTDWDVSTGHYVPTGPSDLEFLLKVASLKFGCEPTETSVRAAILAWQARRDIASAQIELESSGRQAILKAARERRRADLEGNLSWA